jgi:hypothetical protein
VFYFINLQIQKIMNSVQEDKLSMYNVVKDTCETYQTTWSGNAIFANLYELWVAKIPQIEQNRDAQVLVTTGITTGKTDKRAKMTDKALFIINRLQSFGNATNNQELVESIQYSATVINKARDNDAVGICNTVLIKAGEFSGDLVTYGLTTDMLGDLEDAIVEYKTSIAKPKTAISQGKTATENLARLFKEADDLLTKRMDLDIELFKTSAPDFYSQYKTARIIISTGGGTTSVLGNVTMAENGEPVKGVTFTFTPENNRLAATQPIVKKSAEKGNFRIASLPEGIYTVIVSKIGYKEQNLSITVANGETTNLKVEMEKI